MVLTVGELAVDWIALEVSSRFLQPGKFLRSSGGNAGNVAQGLSKLGIASRLLAKVGDDVHGEYLLACLKAHGVDTEHVVVSSKFPTAQCYVLTDEAGENLFFNWPQPNASYQLQHSNLRSSFFDDAFALHATGISLTREPRRACVLEVVREAVKRNLLLSFDAGFPTGEAELAHDACLEIMNMATVVKVNWPELLYWSNLAVGDVEFSLERALELARAFKNSLASPVVIVTLSSHGSYVLFDEKHSPDRNHIYAPPIKVKSVAGVGAGDAYAACLLSELAQIYRNAAIVQAQFVPAEFLLAQDWQYLSQRANYAGAMATKSVSAVDGQAVISQMEEQ